MQIPFIDCCAKSMMAKLSKLTSIWFSDSPIRKRKFAKYLNNGLYPTGSVMERCQKYNWDFMIVLKNGSLPTVWDEYHGLQTFLSNQEYRQNWGERTQSFRWANDNAKNNGKASMKKGVTVTQTATHACVSSKLRRNNIHQRCNLGARHRCGIEIMQSG